MAESDKSKKLLWKLIKTPFDPSNKNNCCKCIPLPTACLIISCITFLWSLAELLSLEKFISRLFKVKGEVFYYSKICYFVLVVGLALASCLLMIALLTKSYYTASAYVWYAFFFTIIYAVVYLAGMFMVVSNDAMTNKLAVRMGFAVLWLCLFWYLLKIVNSFRMSLYWK